MKPKGIGELLVRESLIDIDQLEHAKKEQKRFGGRLTTALVKLGYVKESELSEFLGQQYQVPNIDLSSFEIDYEAIKLVSKSLCEKYHVIPVSKAGDTLVVAFSDPTKIFVRDDLSLVTRHKIEVVVASELAIQLAIDKYYGADSAFDKIISEIEDAEESLVAGEFLGLDLDAKEDPNESPIIRFVNAMLSDAIKMKASDIHVEPYEKRFRVRFRMDGSLIEMTQPPQGTSTAIVSRIKVLSRMDIGERRRPQDGRLRVRLNKKDIDFRVNSIPTVHGEKIVLRVLDKSNLQVDMTKLGMEQDQLDIFKEVIHLPQGLVLLTGPTGSGKTTTIYSALAELNQSDTNVCTAEDPVEFNLDGINQVQVNPAIDFTFAHALRAFLRQDPEVIMVGEIRDLETAEIAYKAASTGHLVVSTLHTNDAASTVTRLVDMGIPPFMVAEATSLVVAQRLLRKICSNCKVDFKVPDESLLEIGIPTEELSLYKNLKKGEGCESCRGTGLAGRIAIYEVMKISLAIKEAIFRNASPLELKRSAVSADHMRTLRQSALLKFQQGLTTFEEVLNVTVGDNI